MRNRRFVLKLDSKSCAAIRRPIRGSGGFQSALKRVQALVSDDCTLSLEADDVAYIRHLALKYRQGGFQARLQGLLAALDELERRSPGLHRALDERATTLITRRLDADQLHEAFITPLRDQVVEHSTLDVKPLEVSLKPPLPAYLRVYIYNLTHPPGGRTQGEHKVQITLPNLGRGQRGYLDHSDGRIVLLVGYDAEMSVFVLWDAGLYRDIPFSRNVQVKAETVYGAYATGLAKQERQLWGGVQEVLVAAFSSRLAEAIQLRVDLSLARLLS